MKKTMPIVLTILVVIGIYFVLIPRRMTDERIVSLPSVRIDSVVQLTGLQEGISTGFVIPFYNTGADSIRIHHVETFCGCLQSELTKRIIPPADSAVLIMSIQPLNRGHMTQQIYMYVENKSEPLKIVLKGFVK